MRPCWRAIVGFGIAALAGLDQVQASSCPRLYGALPLDRRFDPAIEGYYAVEARRKSELEATYGRSRFTSSSTAMSQAQRMRKVRRDWSVRFPQDPSETAISLFGRPYRHEGREVVDFQISGFSHPERDDGRSHVLRRMPYSDFEALALPGFLTDLRQRAGTSVLLPLRERDGKRSAATSELFRVRREIGGRDGIFELESTSHPGRVRRASAREILYWNFDASPNELKTAREFFEAGGKGDLVRLAAENDPDYHGHFIAVRALPSRPVPGARASALADPEVHAEIRRSLERGTPVFLADDSRHFYGVAFTPDAPTMRSLRGRAAFGRSGRPGMLLTSETDLYYIRHEQVHWDDMASNELLGFEKALLGMVSSGRSRLALRDAESIYALVMEQRAYARQLDAIKADRARKAVQLVRERGTGRFVTLDFETYLEKSRERFKAVLRDMYGAEAAAALDRLRERDPSAHARVLALMRGLASESEDLGLGQLVPSHF